MNLNNKIMLMMYGMGALAGILSGLTGDNTPLGVLIGVTVFILSPKIITRITELPDDMQEEAIILRKSVWGFLLFWFYFWVLTYNLLIGFEPIFYAPEKSLYYNMTHIMG